MRETAGVGCGSAFVLACLLAVVLLFAAVGTGLLPVKLWFERQSVEQSKSYVDAMNLQMETAIQEYGRLEVKIAETKDENLKEVYRGQQKVIVNGICSTVNKMQPGTVGTQVSQFISGKCR